MHIYKYRLQSDVNKTLPNVHCGYFWVRRLWVVVVPFFPLLSDLLARNMHHLLTFKKWMKVSQWHIELTLSASLTSAVIIHSCSSNLSTFDLTTFHYNFENILKCRSSGIHSLQLQWLPISYLMRPSLFIGHSSLLMMFIQVWFPLLQLDPSLCTLVF